MNSRVWRIATLIKLVAVEDIPAISFIANKLRQHYDLEDIDDVDNMVIYECYCNYEGDNV